MAVGPTALISLLLASSVRALAGGDPARYLALALVLTVLVAVLQAILGLARFGVVTNFLPDPVLTGFSAAAAFIIILSQVGHLLGIPLESTDEVYLILWTLWRKFGALHGPTVALGLGGIAVILGLQQWRESIPGALVVVVLSTLLVWGLGLRKQGVAIVGDVPGGLPTPTFAPFNITRLFGARGMLT